MKSPAQYEVRRETILVQALGCFSASFLFTRGYVTKPTLPYTVPDEVYLALGSFFLLLALFLVVAPLSRFLLPKSENVVKVLWLAISYTSLGGILVAWLDGVVRLDPSNFWFHWFFWVGLIWFLIFAFHFVRSARQQGQRLRSR